MDPAPPQPETNAATQEDDAATAEATTDLALYCPSCMYDLRGLTGAACPECGCELDRELLNKSSIHWVHRKGLGVGAFLKTAWRAAFKTEFFCMEIARPVSLGDARKFRRRVVWMLAVVGLLFGLMLALMAEVSADPLNQAWIHRPWLFMLTLLLAAALLWVFLMGFTGLHMYWFHPKALSVEQQNRAIAISHYACAPLLWLIPAVVGIALAILISQIAYDVHSDAWAWLSLFLGIPSGLLVILSLTAYLFVCARMAQHTAHRSGITRLALWLVLPVLWLVWAGLILFVLPLAGFYVYLMVSTL